MKKTYFFRRYINTPLLFTNLGITGTGLRNEVEVTHGDNNIFFTNNDFIIQNNINIYTINSYKQVTRSKLFVRNNEGNYIIPNLFQEDFLIFFILNGLENNRNCYINGTKEGFKQLL